jgi:hypothetical protein
VSWSHALEWSDDPRVNELRRAMIEQYHGNLAWESEGYTFVVYPWRSAEKLALGIITLTASLPLTRSLLGGLGEVEVGTERFRLIVPPAFDVPEHDFDPLPCIYIVSAKSPGEAPSKPIPQLLMTSDVFPGMTCLVPLEERPEGWPP